MLQELFIALVKAGIPVGLASYALVWWVLKQNYLGDIHSLKDLDAGIKKHKKDRKNDKKNRKNDKKNRKNDKNSDRETASAGDPLHNKWVAFGGGFYGLVGLLTYARVELGEIRDFVLQFEGIGAFFSDISLDMLINLFIEGIMNFVIAIAWPAYWISEIRSDRVWVWFLVAYGAYWAGARLALQRKKKLGYDI